MVISRGNRILFDSVDSSDSRLTTKAVVNILIPWAAKELKGSYGFLAHPWANAYYHWIIEILPKLDSLRVIPEISTIPLIVPRKLAAFQDESLRMAGISPERIVRLDSKDWAVENLYFPGTLSPSGSPSPHAVAWLRRTFIDVKMSSTFPPSRLIYVTRRDALQRRVLNESEVVEFLRRKGFEVICPGDYSFAQQINIFSEAKVVVAPHGAGLTNMVFAPSGTTLIEFFGENYINGCYWAIANICGHRHAFLTGPSQALDYTVPVKRLRILLSQVSGL
jgi:capsular polysaccharide biosynthesis protein